MVIAHASELTGDDALAFVHAAALAAAGHARLVTVHGNAPASEVSRLPDAAELVARWGRPIEHERRCHECCDDVADTVIDAMRELRPDLVVLGTHARHGLAAFVRGSISESIARNVDAPVLVVPNHARGFVDPATGAIDLQRIVIAAGDDAAARRGREAAHQLLELSRCTGATLELVHATHGSVEDAILDAARAHDACVIVMPTRGHDGVGDVVLGSHTERVIREAACPVLAVPL